MIDAQITIDYGPNEQPRTSRYGLVTTLTDHRAYPALQIVELYHQR